MYNMDNKLLALCDSDSEEESDVNNVDAIPTKHVDQDNDSNSDSNSDGSATDTNKPSDDQEVNEDIDTTKKISRKKKSKKASSSQHGGDELMKLKSESQRLVRECTSVKIPYHVPKPLTLDAFLNRKPIKVKDTEAIDLHKNPVSAIKMSPNELTSFANQLAEREMEAIVLFGSDNEEETESKEKSLDDSSIANADCNTVNTPVASVGGEDTPTVESVSDVTVDEADKGSISETLPKDTTKSIKLPELSSGDIIEFQLELPSTGLKKDLASELVNKLKSTLPPIKPTADKEHIFKSCATAEGDRTNVLGNYSKIKNLLKNRISQKRKEDILKRIEEQIAKENAKEISSDVEDEIDEIDDSMNDADEEEESDDDELDSKECDEIDNDESDNETEIKDNETTTTQIDSPEDIKNLSFEPFDVDLLSESTQIQPTQMLKPVENISDGFKIMSQMNDDELAMMCSGGFGTIPQTAETSEKCDNAVESDEEDFNESTLNKQSKKARVLQISDDEDEENDAAEEPDEDEAEVNQKDNALNFFDDEVEEVIENEDNESVNDESEAESDGNESEIEEPILRNPTEIDYDSEENEVKVNQFLDKEAELSGDEWSSADENEFGMDNYDIELGDEDKFDQDKLKGELEKIYMQHQLRDDARELRILKDMFMDEEEDNGRERKFRWKNIDQNLAMEYISKFHENIPLTEDNGSEDEREMEYRKMRHERESMLNKSSEKKQEQKESSRPALSTIRIMNTNISKLSTPESIFLVSKSKETCYRGSFLSSDENTLQKLNSTISNNLDDIDGDTNNILFNKRKTDNKVLSCTTSILNMAKKRKSLDSTSIILSAKKKKFT